MLPPTNMTDGVSQYEDPRQTISSRNHNYTDCCTAKNVSSACLGFCNIQSILEEERETNEDDPRPGRPSTSKTDEHIEKIGKVIREDRCLSIRGLAEITRIDKECVRQILHESFNMSKVGEKNGAKNGAKTLTPEQKESRMTICADILNNNDTDPGLLNTVSICKDKIRNEVEAKATEVLNQLTEADFQHCFQQWKRAV
ncbi:hypothetical protein NQ318_013044 [Aromia moschata]|uniref:Uncharacterized protein n=1 Tax=Aromia moschata TaxID=1265417 RepID=A0AAV8XN27_9CUCU|nr:hypothetical protein NQ318_013044 [Aromia moschata]